MLHDVAIFLAAAVIAVPLARRLGLGAVLGYLGAGLAVGDGLDENRLHRVRRLSPKQGGGPLHRVDHLHVGGLAIGA